MAIDYRITLDDAHEFRYRIELDREYDAQAASLAGVHEVTLLLADLRGFTVLAATRSAQEVVAVLNRCLARLSAVVFKHQGTIEQFLGDSIRVVFSDVPGEIDHVERALVCAVEMQLAMRDLNLELLREPCPDCHHRSALCPAARGCRHVQRLGPAPERSGERVVLYRSRVEAPPRPHSKFG